MKIGYARVSKQDQNLEKHIQALKDAGCERIFSEKRSGKDVSGKVIENMKLYVRPGDTIVVWSLDRLGRDLFQTLLLVNTLREKLGCKIQSLTQELDFDTAVGKLMVNMALTIAQYERDMIIERTHLGLKHARAKGKHPGRKKGYSKATEKDVAQDFLSLRRKGLERKPAKDEVREKYKISEPTFYKYLKNEGVSYT